MQYTIIPISDFCKEYIRQWGDNVYHLNEDGFSYTYKKGTFRQNLFKHFVEGVDYALISDDACSYYIRNPKGINK